MWRTRLVTVRAFAAACAGLAAGAVLSGAAREGTAPPRATDAPCRVTGRIEGLGTPLPGVAVTARREGTVAGATSTSVDGTYRLSLPDGTYDVAFELAGFTPIEREIAIGAASCEQVVDLVLVLAPRRGQPEAPAGSGRVAMPPPAAGLPAPARGFQTLALRLDAAVDVLSADTGDNASEEEARLLLPPGFTADEAADAISITGGAARVDRGLLSGRLDAIARGEIPPFAAEAAAQFGVSLDELAERFGQRGRGVAGGASAQGGAAGGQGGQRRGGGPGGEPGAFLLGGRLGRGGRLSATADYTFGGSALDASPYQLRSDSPRTERPYTRQSFGGTVGGPLRIPGIYDGTTRSTFTLTYNGGRGSSLFDQYATVPTLAMRNGDFSSLGVSLIDPHTGQPFAGNQIPADRMSSAARQLMRYIPEPNLPGETRNYRFTTTTPSETDAIDARITHMLVGSGRGGAGAGRGRGGGGRGGGGRGRGAGVAGTTVTMNAQLQYRRSDNEQNNVFATLGGRSRSTTAGVPVTVNVITGRDLHAVTTTFSRSSSETANRFTGLRNVSAEAGIQGVSSDPLAWGLPALSFSSITSLRDVTPSQRTDRRLSAGYTWTRQRGRHTIRAGGDVRFDHHSSQSEPNANGAFVFTGIYTSGTARAYPFADVADFLLGLPQQASIQYGPGNVVLTGRSLNLFAMDDWRARGGLTLNLGVRYELLWPFVERDNRLVNLDVAPDFTAAAPVLGGGTGPFSGEFPDALLRTDTNNIAPRIGVAWRGPGNFVLRGGYGVSYNAGSYSAIARQLASQPPFAVTGTRIGAINRALLMEDALSSGSVGETTNTYGVDKDYVLGRVQTWNADASRNLGALWAAGVTYTHTRGSSLDVVRAPNRDATGLRIPGVQPFLWQSAEGSSVLNSLSVRLQRRSARGIGGQISYTLARSRDNAPSIGGGSGQAVVAQNDQDLEAEWGLSNFDQRHRFSANLNVELPFGPNRRWLAGGGPWAALLEGWRLSFAFTADSGTPLTARVRGASRDVSQGLNGALRADYDGSPIALGRPTVDRFFNTDAFSVPAPGLFGTSPRNTIIGPGSRQLNGQLARDIRLGGNRTLSLQLRGTNLLNMVNYAAVDTWVNSPTFGQVLGVRPMRSVQFNVRVRF